MAEHSDTLSTLLDENELPICQINEYAMCSIKLGLILIKAWAAQHQNNVDLKEYLSLEPYQVLCLFCEELQKVDGEVPYLICLKY